MASALRVLAALFDVDTAKATENLRKLDTGISSAKKSLSTVAASLVGAFSIGAVKHFIGETIELGSQLNDTSEKLGVSTQALQQFQYAAGLSGVGAEQAGTALQFLNKNLGEAIGGGQEQAKTFQALGISLDDVKNGTKNAADLLPDIAKKFEETGSDAERTALAMKIFGKQGAALIPLLKQGSGELANLREEFYELGGGMQEDFIKMADKAGDELDRLKFAMTGLKSRIAVAVLPTVTDFAKHLQRIAVFAIKLTKETHIVKEGLAILGVIGAAAGLKTALAWGKVFGLFPKGNMGILQMLASLGWIGVAIAAVVGLGLVFEDLWVGINGGKSVIRDWLTEAMGVEDADALFAQLGQVVEQIKASFVNMTPALKSIGKMLLDLLMSPAFIASVEYLVRLLGSMVALLAGAANATGKVLQRDWAGAGKAVDQAGDAVFGKDGFFGANAFKPYAPRSPAPAAPSMNVNDLPPANINAPVNNVFNINGAGDPNAVGQRVARFQRNAAADNAAALGALGTGAGADE